MKKYSPEEIEDLRLALRLTQEEFGQMLNVNRRTIIRWELGKSPPPFRYMRRLNRLDLRVDRETENS